MINWKFDQKEERRMHNRLYISIIMIIIKNKKRRLYPTRIQIITVIIMKNEEN